MHELVDIISRQFGGGALGDGATLPKYTTMTDGQRGSAACFASEGISKTQRVRAHVRVPELRLVKDLGQRGPVHGYFLHHTPTGNKSRGLECLI